MTKDMSKIIPPPERESFEKEIAHLFVNGDLSDIARLLQKDQSLVSKAFNPYTDEKHNPVYQFVLHLWAFDAIRDGLAGEVLNIVLREREKWHTHPPCGITAEKVGHELIEAMATEIEGCDADTQAKEWDDVERAARERKNAAISQRNVARLKRA